MPSAEWYEATGTPPSYVADKSARRAIGTAKRIMDKPTDIVIRRNGAFIDSQTVRIEGVGAARLYADRSISNTQAYIRPITIFGVRDHETLPDADLKLLDQFGVNGDTYSIIGVTLHSGEIQATAIRLQP